MDQNRIYKELMYPMEWFFRFVTVGFLALILSNIWNPRYWGFTVLYYAFMIAAGVAFFVQILFILNFWRDNKNY